MKECFLRHFLHKSAWQSINFANFTMLDILPFLLKAEISEIRPPNDKIQVPQDDRINSNTQHGKLIV